VKAGQGPEERDRTGPSTKRDRPGAPATLNDAWKPPRSSDWN
jgi:hypothetical protein